MAAKRRKLQILDLKSRISVIKEREKGASQRTLAAKFNVGKTQIYKILANKNRYLQEWQENENGNYKRKKSCPNESINNKVWQWFKNARAKGINISGPILQEKAREFANAAGVLNFAGSNGWLQSFRKRHNIVFRSNSEKTNEVEEGSVINWLTCVKDLIKGYELEDIYNMDETSLFFRAIPGKMIPNGDESAGRISTHERITVAFCVNAIGEKERLIIISQPESLTDFDIDQKQVECLADENAWMTSTIFVDWLNRFNEKMKNQNKNVLLFLDNAPCHLSKEEFSNVKLRFLPADSTIKIQPLSQGIIRSFKLHYRKKLLQEFIRVQDNSTSTPDLGDKISVSEAFQWLKQSWDEVDVITIRKCFARCGIEEQSSDPTNFQESEHEEEIGLLSDIVRLGLEAEIQFELSELDEDIDCYETNTNINCDNVIQDEESSKQNSLEKPQDTDEVLLTLPQAMKNIYDLKRLAVSLNNQYLLSLLQKSEIELVKESHVKDEPIKL